MKTYTRDGTQIEFHHIYAVWSGPTWADGTEFLGRVSVTSMTVDPSAADAAEVRRRIGVQWPQYVVGPAGAVVRHSTTEELVPCACGGSNSDCPECDGTGQMLNPEERCETCKGDGSVCVAEAQLYGPPERCHPAEYADCPSCDGFGRVAA